MNAEARRVAEAVREACLRAALEAFEDAGLRGLCGDGRLEVALDAVRDLDLQPVVAAVDEERSVRASRSNS